jgi:hypothetical protein
LHFFNPPPPFEEDLAIYLNNIEFPLPKGDLYQVWLKLICSFWRWFKKRFNVISLSCNYLPKEKEVCRMIDILSILSTLPCCTITNLHRVDIVNLYSFFFTSFTSSTWRCCTISNQHRVDIVYLSSYLHRSHRRHRDVVRYRINIVSTLWIFILVYIVHIVDMAMLYDIKSTPCLRCTPFLGPNWK